VKYAFIRSHRRIWPAQVLCRILQVARSGYYAWTVKRRRSRRRDKRARMYSAMRRVFLESRRTYGSPRVHKELLAQGYACCVNSVARWMKAHELRAKTQRRFRVKTTDSRHDEPIAANHLRRRFQQPAANRVWVSDISYVPTQEGWLFVAVMLDLFSRRVIGWSMGEGLAAPLVTEALKMALRRRSPEAGLMIHSDRGVQYACGAYRKLLEHHEVIGSMSRRGNCYDNAVMESFYKTLKSELVYHEKYQTREEARQSIFEYIEVFYNRQRRHSALGYLSPEAFEAGHGSTERT
jgi:putative transposase